MNPESYRALFVSESRERLGSGFELLERFPDPEARRELMRCAHSLKGMAATMGYTSMVRLAHAMEDVLQAPVSRGEVEMLRDGLVALGAIVDAVAEGESAESPRARDLASRLRAEPETTPAAPLPEPPKPSGERRYDVELRLTAEDPLNGRDPTVRVLANLASLGRVVGAEPPQLSEATGGFDRRLAVTIDSELDRDALDELLACISGVDAYSVEPGRATTAPPTRDDRDPGWLRVRADDVDRAIEDSLDLITELGQLRSLDLSAHDRVSLLARSLHDRLGELRLVPFETLMPRLQQAVHGLGADLDKPCRLLLSGGELRIDRALLDALTDPLLHLLRNAIDHGLENAVERRASGKPESGRIDLAVGTRAGRVRVEIADDGRGLDPAALRRRAVERGILDPEAARSLGDAESLSLISRAGFSTVDGVSEVSGRGFGVDIVRRAVESLGGRLTIRSARGRGTRFVLDVPANQSLTRALVVRCGPHRFAVPSSTIRRVVPLDGATGPTAEAVGDAPRTRHLLDTLGLARDATPARRGLIVDGDACREALLVEEVEGEREVIVRPLGAPLDALGLYDGAALTEDGAILLVVDPRGRD